MKKPGSRSKKSAPTSWGAVAEWYDDLLEQDQDSYQRQIILPNLLRLLELRAGDRVLDLACGSGFFSRAIAAEGAAVSAADVSNELIALAREKSTANIRYAVTPAHTLPFLSDGTMDKGIIVLALQNIKEARETLREAGRVLKSFGSLVIVLNHPAFRIPKESSWGFDEKKNTQYRRIDRYLSEMNASITMHPGKSGSASTLSYHRPLQFYFKELRAAGFAVTHCEEWISHKKSGKGPRQKAEDQARKEIPLFLALRALKLTL